VKFAVALCILISATVHSTGAWSIERNWCGVYGTPEVELSPIDPLVVAGVVFIAYQPNTPLPSWSNELKGDFSQYLKTMSANMQDMEVRILKRSGVDSTLAWNPSHDAAFYRGTDFEHSAPGANQEIIQQLYNANTFWSAGLEVLFIVHFECASGFKNCGTDSAETAQPNIGVPGWTMPSVMVEMETIPGKNVAEVGLMHEYLHKVGFNHPPRAPNYGRYDIMTGTQDGIAALPDGLVPVHPFELSRDENDWAPPPTPITSSTLNVEVPDFFGTLSQQLRKTYQISVASPEGTAQAFFLVNHQRTTPFDFKYEGHGLLIWHFLDGIGSVRVARDLELASGKFTGLTENPSSGKDALEASTRENPYLGSATDFFDGTLKKDFSYSTNPNTDLYVGDDYDEDPQESPSGVAIENIRQQANGKMMVDVYLTKAQLIESPGAPNEASITRGSTVQINWRVRPLLGAATVDIDIAETATGEFRPLASGLPNTGTYNWIVLQKAGTAYRLKLTTRASGGSPHVLGTDISDNPIEILDNRSCP